MTTEYKSRFFPKSEDNKIFEYVVKATFPNLNPEQLNILGNYMIILIQYIATCFDFYSDIDAFRNKLKQNSYKDCRWLLTYLVPYINSNIKGFDEIKDLNELYTLEYKEIDVKKLPENTQRIISDDNQNFKTLEPISFRSPKYVFSNVQYGRFDKSGNTYKSIKFDYSHIKDNFYLLLDTIKSMRYKMHINWIDILPFRLDNYKESNVYKYTVKKITSEKSAESKESQSSQSSELNVNRFEDWDPIEDLPLDKFNNPQVISSFHSKVIGLNIGDVYNTISMDLYDSIVKIKWLLFDTIIEVNTVITPIPLIFMLKALFPTDEILTGTKYIGISDTTKNLFEDQLNILIKAYNDSTPMTFTTDDISVVLLEGSINTLINAMVMFIDQKYSKIFKKDSTYTPLDESIKKKNIDDYDQTRSYDKSIIQKTLKSISAPLMYNFLVDVLEEFKNTWYSNKLLTPDKSSILNLIDDETGYNYVKIEPGLYITYKNIYNFCKSFVHYNKKKVKLNELEGDKASTIYKRYSKLWSGLTDTFKEEFTKKINGEIPHISWFNIYWNLFHVTKEYNQSITTNDIHDNIISSMGKIYDTLKTSIVDIIFESMIINGTLTNMVAITELTNAKLYDMSIKKQKIELVGKIADKYFKEKSPYMSDAYYYLTNKPFDQIKPFRIKFEGEIKEYNYSKIVSDPGLAAYLAPAYHWIAQVGFCHRFIHNRVNYITGATGAGKSTEIPKLYIYYSKSIDRIPNTTVIVTVPRKNVAEENSEYVSNQLALPREVYDQNDKAQESNNFTIQYKHSTASHYTNGNFPKIQFVTDGTVRDMLTNPLGISTHKNKNKNFVYGRSNEYHIIIVDEAHEHNANMDMILSMAKNVAFYNNRIRIVIVSATMDADEPTYRRFYRDLNDNRKYPLNNWIEKHKLDRINTERRFHISPPDVGTKFKIDEYYLPDKKVVDIVKEIVNNSRNGEILVFHPGSADITATVSDLNEHDVMPSDVIALPYHAKMPKDKQYIVKKIHDQLKNIKINKSDNFITTDIESGTNSYNRAVIVSTNISEASITYPSLKYVVETGVEKTGVFDYKTRSDVLKEGNITEASRLQRKGRVGRTSPGTVYYTYSKGLMESNKKQFNISIQDLHLSIFQTLLRDESENPIFTPLVTEIVSGRFKNKSISSDDLEKQIIKSYSDISKDYDEKFVESIVIVIKDLYISNDMYYSYTGDMYDNTTNSKIGRQLGFPYPVYFSGYDVEQLTDNTGKFYIVHPNELDVERNINGDIVYIVSSDPDSIKLVINKNNLKIPNIENQIMDSNKIGVFWSTLLDMKLCKISNNTIIKTGMGAVLQYALAKLKDIEDINLAKLLILSYGVSKSNQEFDRILGIISYLIVVRSEPRKMFVADPLIINKYKQLSIDRGRLMSPSNKDILQRTKKIINIDNKCHSDLTIVSNVTTIIDKLIKIEADSNVSGDSFDKLKFTVGKNDKVSDLLSLIDGLTDSTGFNEDGLEYRDYTLNILINDYTDLMISTLEKNLQLLNDIGIDQSSYKRFLKLREKLRKNFRDMINDVDGFSRRDNKYFNNFIDIKKFMKRERDIMDSRNIGTLKGALLLAQPYSLVRKIDNTQHHYVSVYSPNLSTMYSIKSTSRNKYFPDTYVDPSALQEYIHHIQSNTESASISGLTRIVLDDLYLVADIYIPLLNDEYGIGIDNDAIKKYTESRYTKRHIEKDINITIGDSDEFDAVNKVNDTVEKIKGDLQRLNSSNSYNLIYPKTQKN
jgi:hypothetical protein